MLYRTIHTARRPKLDTTPAHATPALTRPKARRVTRAAGFGRPRRLNAQRDAARGASHLAGRGSAAARVRSARVRSARAAQAAPAPRRVDPDLRRGVQAVGGGARGVATAGSGAAQRAARSAPFKLGRAPGAAMVTGAFALHDTVREFQRSGASRATSRTAARGVGGVAGAFKGGAIGASIGAVVGGPVGAAVGGAAGAIIGGVAGSSVGHGIADGFAAAHDVIRRAKVASPADVLRVGGRAAWEGVKALGGAAARGAREQVEEIGEGIGEGARKVADAAKEALDMITPW